MSKNILRFLFIAIVILALFILKNDVSLAAPPSSVVERVSPFNGATNVPVIDYFKWNKVDGATKYILTIDEFAEDQDNIPATSYCSGGTCSFGFLALTIGKIEEGSSGDPQTYNWKIKAANTDGDGPSQPACGTPSSPPPPPDCGWRSFTTEIVEELPPSPPPPVGGGAGGDPAGKPFKNPISSENITALFNKIFSFLFGLSIFIVPVVVIYAAFLMLMGGGDPEKLAKGRMILMWTAVAFMIILISRGLPIVFKNLL